MSYDDYVKSYFDIIERESLLLQHTIIAATNGYFLRRADINSGTFNPIEWTHLMISAYFSAFIRELEVMGETANKIEGNDLYSRKVKKMEKQLIEIGKKMSDLNGCFSRQENH